MSEPTVAEITWSDKACRAVVEGMRAKCEEIARAELSDWRGTVGAVQRIIDAIAALKAAASEEKPK